MTQDLQNLIYGGNMFDKQRYIDEHCDFKEANESPYCPHCHKPYEELSVCSSCGEEPNGNEIDYGWCNHCKDHLDLITICSECGEEL